MRFSQVKRTKNLPPSMPYLAPRICPICTRAQDICYRQDVARISIQSSLLPLPTKENKIQGVKGEMIFTERMHKSG